MVPLLILNGQKRWQTNVFSYVLQLAICINMLLLLLLLSSKFISVTKEGGSIVGDEQGEASLEALAAENVKKPAAAPQRNKQSLIYDILPETNTYRVFEEWRLKQLQDIVSQKGSIQSNDVLEYREFEALKELAIQFKEHKRFVLNGVEFNEKFPLLLAKFEAKVHSLDKRIDEEILTEHAELGKMEFDLKAFESELKNEEKLEEKPHHRLVIVCKQFMRRLMSEEGEGSWLDVFSFMNDEEAQQEEKYLALKRVFELSKLQSEVLDELINEEMWREHLAHEAPQYSDGEGRGGGGGQLNRAVVEGAGAAGLFTAFQLFLAGMRVLLVNDRPEIYIQSRIILMDPKWMCQLRYFLGTHFDKLFVGQNTLAHLIGQKGVVNCHDFETTLLHRLVELASYVQKKQEDDDIEKKKSLEKLMENGEDSEKLGLRLDIRYETEFVRIEKSKEGEETAAFTALLETATRHTNPEAAKWNINKAEMLAAKDEISFIQAKNRIIKSRAELIVKQMEKIRKPTKAYTGIHANLLEYKPHGKQGKKETISPFDYAEKEFRGEVLEWQPPYRVPLDLLSALAVPMTLSETNIWISLTRKKKKPFRTIWEKKKQKNWKKQKKRRKEHLLMSSTLTLNR